MKSLFEKMGGTYQWEGDYLLPNLELPAEGESLSFGMYCRICIRYLKRYRRALYSKLLLSGKLDDHLRDVDERATT